MKAILAGYGEVGKGIFGAWKDKHEITIQDMQENCFAMMDGDYKVMLVAFPYSENFIQMVRHHQGLFQPKVTIIFSTVPVGTTSQIENAVHSPIEGHHENMVEYIKAASRWIGGYNKTAMRFFLDITNNIVVLEKPEYTEFLKLRSLAYYASSIEFARYTDSVCEKLDLDYGKVIDYDRDYNWLVEEMGRPDCIRSILTAPKEQIGGHCILPGVKMLRGQYPDSLVSDILYKNNTEDKAPEEKDRRGRDDINKNDI